ncbi:hypothetical protein AB0A05_27260 [Streptomyces sp. NPDC046374]|uniref:hypothetical protein n=1 Tax=Streptomyces sp. NPDC046374 TaxID=3154917 RepID=UPI0033D839CF
MPTEYVSPFQPVGHDGPCHSLRFRPTQPPAAEEPQHDEAAGHHPEGEHPAAETPDA